MFLLDSLLINGLRFVLDKVAVAADAELDDEARLRELLVDAQGELEAGLLSEADYATLERDILDRISRSRRGRRPGGVAEDGYRVTGAEVEFTGGDDDC